MFQMFGFKYSVIISLRQSREAESSACMHKEEIFHCYNVPTLLTVGVKYHSGFECLIVCPHFPVEDLKSVSLVLEVRTGSRCSW
jgi:hypothetical protein